MTRAPGLARRLVLPVPPEKYDAQDQRELRRILEANSQQPAAFDAVINTPAPISALGGLTGAADTVPYFTGAKTMSVTALTPYVRTLLAAVDAAAARTTLGAVLARSNIAVTTASLANLASESASLATPSSGVSLLTIAATAGCWVRLYASDTAQAADVSRAFGTLPTPGTGVLAEFDFSVIGAATIPCSPVPLLANDEATVLPRVWYTVQNLSGGTTAITLTLNLLPAEL